jgi:putative membrane protein
MQKSDSVQKTSFIKQHFKAIASAAVVLIPTIYTTLFLGSMWDPYGSIDDLPVAVVNHDQPVEYEGKTLDVGGEFVKKLNDNASLDFHFVDDKKATEGLADGTYYMVISVPSDFSENAATLMDDTPKKMTLQYSTNPGTNYIASKMSESALTKIEKEISASVTKEYAETIFEQLGDIGSGMTDAADGAGELQDGIKKLSDGNNTITDNLNILADSTLTFTDGAKTLENGLKTYTDGVVTVNSGAGTLADGMKQLSDGTDSLTAGASALKSGTSDLYDGVNAYTNGAASALSGAQQLYGNSEALRSGAADLTNGTKKLQDGSAAITSGLGQLSSSLNSSLSKENMTQIQQLDEGLTQIQQGISKLNTAISESELPDTSGIVQTLTQSLTSIGTQAQDAGLQLQTLQSAIASMKQTQAFQSLDPASQQELAGCFTEPMTSLASDIQSIGSEVSSLSQTLQGMDLSDSGDTMTTLKKSVAALDTAAKKAIPGAQQTISSLSNGMKSVQQAVDGQLLPGAQQISSGLNQLSDGSATLSGGISAYTGGVSDLESGLKQLNANSVQLNNGAKQLRDGAKELTEKLPTLTNAVSQLKDGSEQLAKGTKELAANNAALLAGVSQLSDGAGQIHDGAGKLADASEEMGKGITAVSDGTVELKNALGDGADEINNINDTDLTYDMMSAPISSEETFAAPVETNGNAMAAYMMAVGLWVAGLAFCVMLSPHDQKIKGLNAKKAWAGQIVKLWGLAILQALIMVFALMLFNGFRPDDLMTVILIACLSSIAFLTLEYCVNFYLGIVGSFVLLVFMVLQLSGCAGTYPKELSNGFYQFINPLMPFTYTVHGFRSGIASGLSVTSDCIVLSAIAIVFAGLLLIGFSSRQKKQEAQNTEQVKVSGNPIHA